MVAQHAEPPPWEEIQADGQMVTSSTPCVSLIHHLLSLITSQISLVLFN